MRDSPRGSSSFCPDPRRNRGTSRAAPWEGTRQAFERYQHEVWYHHQSSDSFLARTRTSLLARLNDQNTKSTRSKRTHWRYSHVYTIIEPPLKRKIQLQETIPMNLCCSVLRWNWMPRRCISPHSSMVYRPQTVSISNCGRRIVVSNV